MSRSRILLAVFAAIALLLGGTLFWLSRESTLQWAAAKVEARSDGALKLDGVTGSLLSRVHVDAVHWSGKPMEVDARDVSVRWSPLWLLLRTAAFDDVQAQSVHIVRHVADDTGGPTMPESLRLPLRLRLDRAHVAELTHTNAEGKSAVFRDIGLALAAGPDGWSAKLDKVNTRWGHMQGEAKVAAESPFETHLAFKLDPENREPGVPPISVDGKADGDFKALDVQIGVRAQTSAADGKARVAPFDPQPVKTLDVKLTNVDPRHLSAGAPQARIDGTLNGDTDAAGQLRGRLQLANALAGRIDEQRVPLRALEGELVATAGRWWIEGLMLDTGEAGKLAGTGWVSASEGGLILATDRLDLKGLHTKLRATALRGTIATTGPFREQHVQIALADPRLTVALDARVGTSEPGFIDVKQARATAAGGRFEGSGRLALDPQHAFSVRLNLARLDPSEFGGYPKASLNGSFKADGVLAPVLQVSADATLAPSTLFAMPATGRALVNSRGKDKPALALDVTAKLGQTQAHTRGTIVDPANLQSLDLQLSLAGADLSELYNIVHLPFPASSGYKLDGHLVYRDAVWSFTKFAGTVGRSDLAGDIAVDVSKPKPQMRATLTSDRLDMRDLGGFVGADPHRDPAPDRVLAQNEFKLDKLNAANVDVRFTGRRFRNERLPLHRMDAHLVLRDGQLTLDPLDFSAAGGRISARIAMDARRKPIATVADVQARALALNRLVPGVKAVVESAGTVDARTRLAMEGNSMAAMLGSADGELKLAMKGGAVSDLLLRLANLDIQNSLIALAKGNENIPVRCFVADLVVEDGVVTPRTLVLDTQHTLVRGEGSLNLQDETLALRFVAQPKDGSLIALRGPIRVDGTLAKPGVHPELGNALARAGAAVALGAVAGPLAIVPLIQGGKDVKVDCDPLVLDASRFIQAENTTRPPGAERATADRPRARETRAQDRK